MGIGYEYRVTDLIGVDVGLSYFGTDVKAGAMGVSISDGGSIMPLTDGAMFHLTRDSKFDFYVGPEIAYVSYGNVRLPETDQDVEFEDEFTLGAKAGIAVPFNEQWSFNASVEYLVLTGEVKDTDPKVEIDPNPLILSVGAALRF